MRVEEASFMVFENLDDPEVCTDILTKIEMIGRTCYMSTDMITDDSCRKFVRGLVKRQHEAMLEHASLTIRFIVDRGVSHEIVRHRVASFAQSSTRYCNYSFDKFGNEIAVIEPCFFNDIPKPRKQILRYLAEEKYSLLSEPVNPTDHEQQYCAWYDSCKRAEMNYMNMLSHGATPQEARAVLPNSLKTTLWMTANLRELRHFLKLRAAGTTGAPHPQMAEVAVPLLGYLREKLPEVFDDIPMPEVQK